MIYYFSDKVGRDPEEAGKEMLEFGKSIPIRLTGLTPTPEGIKFDPGRLDVPTALVDIYFLGKGAKHGYGGLRRLTGWAVRTGKGTVAILIKPKVGPPTIVLEIPEKAITTVTVKPPKPKLSARSKRLWIWKFALLWAH